MAKNKIIRKAPPSRGRVPQTDKAREKRESILEAFIECISEVGLNGATFELVGNRTGLKAPHIAYYFPDRRALLLGAIEYAMQRGQEFTIKRIELATDDRGALAAMAEGAIDWMESEPKYVTITLLFFHLASHDETFKDLNTRIRLVGEDRIDSILQRMGTFRDRSDRRECARNIQGVITGNIVGWMTIRSLASLSNLRKQTVRAVFDLAHST